MVPYSVLSYKIATVPKSVSEQTDKMPLSILFYTKKQIGCASASLGHLSQQNWRIALKNMFFTLIVNV